jgi:hypothetical protein
MSRFAVLLMLGLAGCEVSDTAQLAAGDVTGWRLPSGKRPTRAEYAAVVAACRDGTVTRTPGRPLDACLADLGLHRE